LRGKPIVLKKIYHLKNCSTCIRIIKSLDLPSDVIFQDIKNDEITPAQLEDLYKLSGSYEALFSKRAQRYKALKLKDQNLTEKDFKNYILEHYTFLSRPVIVYNDQIFIGNSSKTVEAAKKAIHEN
jgi:arsenate reductase